MRMKKAKASGTQISDKDKKLIYIVGIVAVLFLGYKFIISPKISDVITIKGSYSTVKDKRDLLKSDYDNIEVLRSKTNKIKYNEERMRVRIPGFDSTSYSLGLIFDNAEKTKVLVSAVTLDKPIYMDESQYSLTGTGSEELVQVPGNKVVVKNSFEITASGAFSDVYAFLKNIEETERKFAVTTISLKEAKAGGISGVFKVTALSFVDKNYMVECPYKIPTFKGRTNIFDVAPSSGDISDNLVYYTPEYNIKINNSNYSGPKVIFMENGKLDTELYCDSKGDINGSLTITGNKDSIRAQCKLDKESKAINSKLDLKEDTIRMTVTSTPRESFEDVVKLILEVDNQTPYKLEITVVNDDKLNPKFNLKQPKDNVIVKGVTR